MSDYADIEKGVYYADSQIFEFPFLRPIVFEMWKALDRRDIRSLVALSLRVIDEKRANER